jgi:hypothetical protein
MRRTAQTARRETMHDRRFDRQDALVLAVGWFTALLVTFF